MYKLKPRWTKGEDDILRKFSKTESLSLLADRLPLRGLPSIQLRKHKLNLTERRVLSSEQLSYIKNNCSSHTDMELSMHLDLPLNVVVYQRRLLAGYREPRGRLYTEDELDIVKSKYTTLTDSELATVLDRTKFSVKSKRLQLGLIR